MTAPHREPPPAPCPHHRVAIGRVGVVVEVSPSGRRRYLREWGVCRGCTKTVTRRTELPEKLPQWNDADHRADPDPSS